MTQEPLEPEGAELDPDAFRDLGYRAVDEIAAYYEDLDERPVFPAETPEAVESVFEEALPETGQDPDAILDDWSERVLPHATHNTSARYFGFVMGSGTKVGVLAEALAASVNMNTGGWKPAPSGTEVERRTVRWLAEMVGYDPDCGGLLTSGGTMANLTALCTGLRTVADYDTKAKGLQADERSGQYTVYMADHEGHSSVYRAAEVLGLGGDAVRPVPSRDDFTMDVDALVERIETDEAAGDVPAVVVGQVGSINTGAIDPLDDIADVCEARDLWFHADGAIGAVGAILPEKRPQYAGLERADSVTLDPHKWLYVPYECGCVLVDDEERLARSFAMDAAYLEGIHETGYEGLDYYEVGPQMSRGFRALKLWMSIKHYGVEGYRELLGRSVDCVEHLDGLVRASPDFEALHEPNLNVYSFRYAPADLQELIGGGTGEQAPDDETRAAVDEHLDGLNQRVADAIRESGFAFVMTTAIHDRTVLRLSVCSHRTTREVIEAVFERLGALGSEMDSEHRPDELGSAGR